MSHTEEQADFRFSLREMLLFITLCAVLAAIWPSHQAVFWQLCLLVSTVLIVLLVVTWRLAARTIQPRRSTKFDYAGQVRRDAFELAQLAVLLHLVNWLFTWVGVGSFCLLPLLDAVAVLLQVFSMLVHFNWRISRPLACMQLTGLCVGLLFLTVWLPMGL